MFSMTGFGKAEYKGGYELSVEIKTVNNRFLDILPKYPKNFCVFDDLIRKTVQKKLSRGRVELFFTFADLRDSTNSLVIDLPLAKAYVEASKKLAHDFSVPDDMTTVALLRFPDVASRFDETDGGGEVAKIIVQVVNEALDKLNCMRFAEGEKLKADLLSRIDETERLTNKIKERAPLVTANYRQKITERVTEALNGASVDETRLLQEVALFADKANIDEEITRLFSHIFQFRKIVFGENPGRKLDFLIQELNREANTVCSKSNDIEITDEALLLKCEIEKMREQIQNVE